MAQDTDTGLDYDRYAAQRLALTRAIIDQFEALPPADRMTILISLAAIVIVASCEAGAATARACALMTPMTAGAVTEIRAQIDAATAH